MTSETIGISLDALLDERLSYGARGMLAIIIARKRVDEGYNPSPENLIRRMTEGRARVSGWVSELVRFGYMSKVPIRDAESRLVMNYWEATDSPE